MAMTNVPEHSIRAGCLRPADAWVQPTGEEVREVLRLAGLSGGAAAKFLGLSEKTGGRTIRRWVSDPTDMPYAVWALLCDRAGLGRIWQDENFSG